VQETSSPKRRCKTPTTASGMVLFVSFGHSAMGQNMELIRDGIAIYSLLGLTIWITVVIRAYDELEAIHMLLGLILCVLIWPLLLISAVYKLTFRKEE
jgi:hypothetical protein